MGFHGILVRVGFGTGITFYGFLFVRLGFDSITGRGFQWGLSIYVHILLKILNYRAFFFYMFALIN